MKEKQTILLADDSETDRFFMRTAFKKAQFDGLLQEVVNGEEAIAYLNGDDRYSDRKVFPLPVVMLLDLNMPKRDGFEVLEWVRSQAWLNRLPIIVLTASTRTEDIERAFDSGASSFLVKPGAVEELMAMVQCLNTWLQYNHFAALPAKAVT